MKVVKFNELWSDILNKNFVSEAVQTYGEQCVIRLKWRVEDFNAGLVERCTSCQASPNPTIPNPAVQSRLAIAYKQTGDWYCPVCFGTLYVGGFKPIIYQTWMLAQDAPEIRQRERSGRYWSEQPTASFYPLPTLKDGDLIIRIEQWDAGYQNPLLSGERFELKTVTPQTIRTGPVNSITRGQQLWNQPWNTLIGQTAQLTNLPVNHPFYSVAYQPPPSIPVINPEENPGFGPHL